jgi:hypothetical protein
MPKRDYKIRERAFILAGALRGLTGKIYNMENHANYVQAHKAMKELGMGENVVQGGNDPNEPVPEPTAAPTPAPITRAMNSVMGAAAEVGADLIRQHGAAVVNAALNTATGGGSLIDGGA